MHSSGWFRPGSDQPAADEFEVWRTRMERPDNEIGWALPLSVVLAQTPDAVVAVTHMTAFTAGVGFNLAVRLRVALDDVAGRGLYTLISPHMPPGMSVDQDQRLLLGVEYADGRTAVSLDNRVWPPGPQDPQEPLLMASDGGGGDLSVDQSFWLSPVPPDGAFTFVCSWPAFGINETRHVIKHADLSTASARARTLWPRQPINHQPPPPPEPRLPSTGWFGQAVRRSQANPPGESDPLQSCAVAVVSDVAATTGLRIEVSTWVDPQNGIGAVVHEAGTHPAAPVWEAVGCLDGGDSLAVHPPGRATGLFPHSGDRTDVTTDIASSAQNLVQMLLWQRGLDPTWPPCPEHEGRHPLYVRDRSDLTTTSNGHSITAAHSAARWECPQGTTTIPIGSLHPPQPQPPQTNT